VGLVQKVQIRVGTVFDEQRFELTTGYVALNLLVICKISRRMVFDLRADLLRCLLTINAETLYVRRVARAAYRDPGQPHSKYLTSRQLGPSLPSIAELTAADIGTQKS
jgi:hypothetical protein